MHNSHFSHDGIAAYLFQHHLIKHFLNFCHLLAVYAKPRTFPRYQNKNSLSVFDPFPVMRDLRKQRQGLHDVQSKHYLQSTLEFGAIHQKSVCRFFQHFIRDSCHHGSIIGHALLWFQQNLTISNNTSMQDLQEANFYQFVLLRICPCRFYSYGNITIWISNPFCLSIASLLLCHAHFGSLAKSHSLLRCFFSSCTTWVHHEL